MASSAPRTCAPCRDYPVLPVPFTDVRIADSFWTPRIETNRKVTISYCFQKCEETGRVKNFDIAARVLRSRAAGNRKATAKPASRIPFDDSDVFKIIEGAAFALSVCRDQKLERYVDSIVAKIAAAQEKDGYLYTFRTMNPEHPPHEWISKKRWEKDPDLSHELYNLGHLYEAGAAYFQATGKRALLDVCLRSAELVTRDFGPGRLTITPGHQVIEMGLVKLYRVTGDDRWLRLSKFFIDERGPGGSEYSQSHEKPAKQNTAVGHAVRAGYLYAGMADIAGLMADKQYRRALERIWKDVVDSKLYITGGIGARHGGEAFGAAFELPNMSAYCESCAAIANVYWNHRMFLLSGEGKYIDVLERSLYNGLISGISFEGDTFFYPNPLESVGQHSRSKWFGCSCCPSNFARFMASIPGYVYASTSDTLYVNLYAQGSAAATVAGTKIALKQTTDYPWDGTIKVAVNPAAPTAFSVALRIPGWARNTPVPSALYKFLGSDSGKVAVKVNGKAIAATPVNGYVVIDRTWKKGDVVTLDLPMPIRRIVANPKVEDDRDKVALQRGPIVFCAEWPDNAGNVLNLLLEDTAALKAQWRKDMLNGIVTITGVASNLQRTASGTIMARKHRLVAIPYYAWAHRGPGHMAVWLPRKKSAVRPMPGPSIASTSRIVVSHDRGPAVALCDQLEPKNSNDHSIPYLHWWPNKGTTEWIEYHFKKAETVSSSKAYWFDDGPWGGCRIPRSWQILYKDGNAWRPVRNPSAYGVAKDKFNRVTFAPITTTALRIEIQLQPEHSGGVLEWDVR